ncbi:MAG: PRC-barrel domain containing protein [Sphingobacteriales bacterium]|nr:MAG: PRC-barrel domain containing protein [Sphingobacteriales bacterium]
MPVHKALYVENNKNQSRLLSLEQSGRHIAEGFPQFADWKVYLKNGKLAGEIKDLLFDEVSKSVKYIVLDLSGNDLAVVERKVVVPIGLAEIDETKKLRKALGDSQADDGQADSDFYNHHHFKK